MISLSWFVFISDGENKKKPPGKAPFEDKYAVPNVCFRKYSDEEKDNGIGKQIESQYSE